MITNGILPQTPCADRVRRMLGRTGSAQEASNQPHCQGRAAPKLRRRARMITRHVLDGPAFDPIDLAPTVLHEIVIVLHDVLELLHVLVVLPTTCIRRSKSSMLATSISATSVQYRSAQKS